MAQFEDQQSNAAKISHEIARVLVGLGVDWNDTVAIRALAREALEVRAASVHHQGKGNEISHLKLELFGLIGLMLKTMEEAAGFGEHVHGGDVWKAMARALWEEKSGGSA